jgi:aminoglycoside phosphotransferase (APT) family kinase protein
MSSSAAAPPLATGASELPQHFDRAVWRFFLRRFRDATVVSIGASDEAETLAACLGEVIEVPASTVDAPEPARIDLPDDAVDLGVLNLSWQSRDLARTVAELRRVVRADGSIAIRLSAAPAGQSARRLWTLYRALGDGWRIQRILEDRRSDDGRRVHEVTDVGLQRGVARAKSLARLLAGRGAFTLISSAGADSVPSEADEILRGEGTSADRARLIAPGSGRTYRIQGLRTIARVPHHSCAVDRCANNYRTLEVLSALRLPFAAPLPLGSRTHGPQPQYRESIVAGDAVESLLRSSGDHAVFAERAALALIALQSATLARVRLDSRNADRLFEFPVRRLQPALPPATAAKLAAIVDDACSRLSGTEFPTVRVHGDFKFGNLLWDRRTRALGIVDWDFSHQGLPVVDAVFCQAADAAARLGTSLSQALGDLVSTPDSPSAYSRFCLDGLGLPLTDYRLCALMALVHYGTHHPGFLTAAEHRRWCDTHLTAALDTACDRFTADR